MTYNFILMN